MFSDSFAGIAPSSVVGYMLAELAGAAIGMAIHEALKARPSRCGEPGTFQGLS